MEWTSLPGGGHVHSMTEIHIRKHLLEGMFNASDIFSSTFEFCLSGSGEVYEFLGYRGTQT